MPKYRRSFVAGGTYFFTVTLRDRGSDLLVREIGVLRRVVGEVRGTLPFRIDAWVVLPEHLHCIWTLPAGDAAYPRRWQGIKAGFSRSLPGVGAGSNGDRGIWQKRYWEHTIRDERDHAVHMDYVHFNPVKHGLVGAVGDWPYSTFRGCVARGYYPESWVGVELGIEAGER